MAKVYVDWRTYLEMSLASNSEFLAGLADLPDNSPGKIALEIRGEVIKGFLENQYEGE